MIQTLRKIFGLSEPSPIPDLKQKLQNFSPEFADGFSERVMKRVHGESIVVAGNDHTEIAEPFDAALMFAFRRISLVAAALTLALIVFDVIRSDNSAVLNSLSEYDSAFEEIIADPLFTQIDR